jgi:hypothetical protein
MLTLPMAVDAAPATAFAGAGTLLLAAGGTAAIIGRRVTAVAEVTGPEPVAGRAS